MPTAHSQCLPQVREYPGAQAECPVIQILNSGEEFALKGLGNNGSGYVFGIGRFMEGLAQLFNILSVHN